MFVSHVDDFAFFRNARFQTEVIEELKSILRLAFMLMFHLSLWD